MQDCYYNRTVREFIPIPKEPHNTNMKNSAKGNATYMKKHPSWLEKKMMEFLDNQHIKYEFQKVFFIKSKGGFIKSYYIVDFYIPDKKVILEVDGQFHKEQKEYDDFRTRDIQKHYPKIQVIRWEARDFHSYVNMKTLLSLIK